MRIAAVIVAACLAGCVVPPPKPAAASITLDSAGSLTFEQTDFAAAPATVSASNESFTLEIPAGSVVSFRDAAAVASDRAGTVTDQATRSAWAVTVSEPTTLHANRRAAVVSGPKSFPPPVGPSPSEIAAGNAAWLWRVGLFAGLALAGLGIWWKGGLVIAGGLSVAGASAFGWFVEENPWLLWIFGGGVALAALGFALWHLWLKKRQGRIEK